MKKLTLFILLVLGLPASAAPTIITIKSLLTCAGAGPAVLVWTGTQMVCASLGTGLALTSAGGSYTLSPTPTPTATAAWNIDTVSLSSLAAGATSLSFTTSQVPINGVLFYFYTSSNLYIAGPGAISFTGNPINFTLPQGWMPSDTIQLVYQYK